VRFGAGWRGLLILQTDYIEICSLKKIQTSFKVTFMKQLIQLFLLLLCACGSNISQNLRVNIGSEPQTLDPRKARSLQDQTMAKVFFEGLSRISPQEKAELALAEKVEISEDGKVYIFTLRNTKWSNGDPVTADDFVYAWRGVLHPDFISDQAFQMYVLKNAKAAKSGEVEVEKIGVRALDTKRLQVELENPTPYLLDLLAMPVFFPIPAKIDRANPHWAEESKTYICNGPFTLNEWKHSNAILVKKNPRYWDAAHVKLGAIEMVMVSEETEFKMYEKKELDWAGSPLSILPLDALPQLKEKKALYQKPFLATYFYRINTEKAPFDDPALRRAFALAINRKEIVEHVTQGGQIPATGLVPPQMGLQHTTYFSDGDVEGARLLLADADLAALPPITLLYLAGERNHLIAQAVQDQWLKAFGIHVYLEPVERKVYYDRIAKKDFQLAAGCWTADYNDPINFLEVFKYKTNGTNNTLWEDSRYITLLDKAVQTADPQERYRLFQASEEILIEAMPIIPLYYYTQLFVKGDRLHDVVVSALGSIDFKWAYIEEAPK
jgi:oligopeptide transport system substrate-binding protein